MITAVGGGSPPTYAYSAGWSYNPNDPLAERSIWVFEFPANGDPAERSLEFFWVPERWSGDINQYPENACFVPTHMEWANDAIFLGSEIQYYVADGLTAGADTTPVLLIEIEQSNDPTVW